MFTVLRLWSCKARLVCDPEQTGAPVLRLTEHNSSLTGVLMQLEFSTQPPFEFSHSLMSLHTCI